MKNELTPQIAAMYIGQKCDRIWNIPNIGESYGPINHDILYWLLQGGIEIRPHLRPPSSLTESEARELYEITMEKPWTEKRDIGCRDDWFNDILDWPQFTPEAFLKLLEMGFDLFGGIEAGWAKEIN